MSACVGDSRYDGVNFSGHAGSKRGFGVVGNGRDIGLFSASGDRCGRGLGRSASGWPRWRHLGACGRFHQQPERRRLLGAASKENPNAESAPDRDRETGRWIDGLRAADRLLGGAAMVTVIADCESDIYEGICDARSAHVHLLVRAAYNRRLTNGGKLFAAMAVMPAFAGQAIAIPAKPGQPARAAQTRVSYGEIEVARSRGVNDPKRLPSGLKLRAVRVEEIDPPVGVRPVLWILLTTHKVESLEDALRIVGWYRARWTIEQVFRTMKTQGFNMEDSQIETPETMAKLALAVLIAALRTMQLVYARSGTTGQKLGDAMDGAAEPLVEALTAKLQGKTEKLKNPHPKNSLARFAWVVGRLGGWDGYDGNGYKPAGPKTISIGLNRFDAIREGWEMKKDV